MKSPVARDWPAEKGRVRACWLAYCLGFGERFAQKCASPPPSAPPSDLNSKIELLKPVRCSRRQTGIGRVSADRKIEQLRTTPLEQVLKRMDSGGGDCPLWLQRLLMPPPQG